MKTYKLNSYGEEVEVAPIKQTYSSNGTLAIHLLEIEDGEVIDNYAMLTVNIDDSDELEDGLAFVDTNNCEWAEDFIIDNKLGKPIGRFGQSGFCKHPLYKFNMNKLNEEEWEITPLFFTKPQPCKQTFPSLFL